MISGLTLFSGFGLGTVLMPVFAIFFPVYIAVMLTAIVHLSNNIFKFILLGRYADRKIVFQFGIPAILAAILGARTLFWLSGLPSLLNYRFAGHDFQISPVKLIVAVLMIVFALFELLPRFIKMSFERKYLTLGGALSGFLGGISGHQGALRSAFLIKCGLARESYISTGVAISCLVDITRIFVYGTSFPHLVGGNKISLLIAAIAFAFLGTFISNRLVKKITMRIIQLLVAGMLIVIAVGLGAGLI